MNPNYGFLDVWYSGSEIRFEDHTAYQTRNPCMINLIRDAWQLGVMGKAPADIFKSFRLYSDDVFNPNAHYSFAANSPENSWRSMPSFIFDKWPECGISSYDEVFAGVVSAGDKPYEDERAFWIGSLAMDTEQYFRRKMGAAVALRRPDLIEFIDVKWGVPSWNALPSRFVDLPGHCRWRVLIDFGAAGFSARVPLLLASGRPVILVGRPEEAWFYWDGSLVPWVHYIPCGPRDGSELTEGMIEEVLEWTFKNRELCEEIGGNGRKYALSKLTRDAALQRIVLMMDRHPSIISGGPLL